jgi:hypothetical protein
MQWADNLGSYQSASEFWASLFSDLQATAFNLGYDAYLTLLSLANGYTSPIDMITTLYDEHYNEMACLLYGQANPGLALAEWSGYLNSSVWSSLALPVRTALLQIASYMPMETMFNDPESLSLPSSFVGRDCSDCAGVPVGWVSCGYMGDIVADCLASDEILEFPAEVISTGTNPENELSYTWENGVLEATVTVDPNTSGSETWFSFNFGTRDGWTRYRRIVRILEMEIVSGDSGWTPSVEGASWANNTPPFVFAGSSGSEQQPCIEDALIAAGEDVSHVDGDIGEVQWVYGGRPDQTTVFRVKFQFCSGERP